MIIQVGCFNSRWRDIPKLSVGLISQLLPDGLAISLRIIAIDYHHYSPGLWSRSVCMTVDYSIMMRHAEVGKSLWWWSDLAKISLACSAFLKVTWKALKKPRSFGFFLGNFSEVFMLRVPVYKGWKCIMWNISQICPDVLSSFKFKIAMMLIFMLACWKIHLCHDLPPLVPYKKTNVAIFTEAEQRAMGYSSYRTGGRHGERGESCHEVIVWW